LLLLLLYADILEALHIVFDLTSGNFRPIKVIGSFKLCDALN